MMLTRLMPRCDPGGEWEFAITANLFGAQPVCADIRQHLAGDSRNTGLQSGESPYRLRT